METSMKSENNKNKSYYQNLQLVANVGKQEKNIIQYLPDFYLLLCNIVSNKKTDWYSKMLANAALSYLVIEEDIIPDRKKDGHLDDLYICAFVLKEIRDKVSKNIILDNAQNIYFEDDILDIIYKVFNETTDYLEDNTERILNLVGFSKFTLFDFLYDQHNTVKLVNRKEKRRLLYSMIAVKAKPVLEDNSDEHSKRNIQNYIKMHHEYGEIERHMEYLNDK